MAKKTNYPIDLRNFVLNNLARFRTAVVKAVRYRKNATTSINTKITGNYGGY